MSSVHQIKAIADIQRRCNELADNAEKQNASRVIQLPLWPVQKRGSPNSFLRSALFAAIQGKDRKFLDKETIYSQGNYSIRFSGKQLNQEDMTVWLALVDLARHHPLGTECSFTAYGILKHMGLKDGGEQRKVLYDSVHRLMACGVEIKADKVTYGGSLVDEFMVDETTGHYKLRLNKKLINIFGQNDWTAISWEQRKKLRSKPLAQKLHEYYSSHERPLPLTIQFLHEVTGSRTKEKFKFKQSVKAALEALVKIDFLTGFKIDGDKVTVERKNPRALAART